jgi:hypothetical protein
LLRIFKLCAIALIKCSQMSIQNILDYGCKPYICTYKHIASAFELRPFGFELVPFFDGIREAPFHFAYLRSNSIAFDAELGMPHWVYVDFVLLQTAAIGFMLHKDQFPKELLARFSADPDVDLAKLEYLPISGQTAGLAADGKTWTGVSLFSLARYIPDLKSLGIATHTRALALKAYRAHTFVGVTQYDNPAIAIHGKTTQALFIKQPMVWIHPRTHMTFVYEQQINFTLDGLRGQEPMAYSFLLRADDRQAKEQIASGIAEGRRYQIVAPFRIVQDGAIFVPIRELVP